jgi:tripartite-type tricarboxylate transporter receptor subunit TctC
MVMVGLIRRVNGIWALLALLSATVGTPSVAQEWPTRPVRIVNTFAPGGAADILARIVADHLSQAFKQQFYVETRAGAGGAIGVQTVANADPDGYNFVITTLSLAVLAPFINPKIGYDPLKDLTYVAYIAGSPILFIASTKSGLKTLADFVAKARTSVKPLTYGSSGLSSAGQMVAQSFAMKTNLEFEIIPYKGASQSIVDVVANHIDFATPTVTSASGQLRGGTVTGLAVSAQQRLADYPDVPTFRELGHDIVATNWFALAGPAGLPADIVAKVNREINAAMVKPDSQQRMREDGMLVSAMDAAALRKFVEDEGVRWKPVIERAGLVEK